MRQLIIILRPGPAQCSSCSCRVLVPRGFGRTGLHSLEISVVFLSFFLTELFAEQPFDARCPWVTMDLCGNLEKSLSFSA